MISVTYVDADGIQHLLAPTSYTITIASPAVGQLWPSGFTVTYPLVGSPIAIGTYLIAQRILPLQQLASFVNEGNFYPTAVERALDTMEMQIQQIAARTGQLRGVWASGIQYNFGDVVTDGAGGLNTGNYYMCVAGNLSTVWTTDLAAGDWALSINVQLIAGYATSAAASAATASTDAGIAASAATSATASAATATTQAGIATTQAGIATTAATQASNYAAAYSGTSTTSLAIATGAKTFSTQSGKLFVAGQYLMISSNANSANYMHGSVTSYSGTSLVMNIADIGGSGTHADWNISISGTQGPTGPSGGGAVTSVSVVSANGLAGTVATATTTPAITLSTSITGVLKGNGTAISAASAGSDYLAPNGNGSALTSLTAANISAGTAGIDISGNSATVTTINGRVAQGTNITITGSGTAGSPYTIAATTAIMTALGVGSVIFANYSSVPIAAGATVSAAGLSPVTLVLSGGSTGVQPSGDSLTGTWQALVSYTATTIATGLWQRIA